MKLSCLPSAICELATDASAVEVYGGTEQEVRCHTVGAIVTSTETYGFLDVLYVIHTVGIN